MVLTILKQAFFPQEFVIDERPVPIYVPERAAGKEPAELSGDGADRQNFGEMQSPDLLSQMAELLLEQVRLAEKARQLELNNAGDDEFGRFVRHVLPFLDNFARLLDMAREHEVSTEISDWLRSVESLYYRLVTLLDYYGLRFINSMGKIVDLNVHEVVDYRITSEYPHNTIIKEMQKGIVFRGRLLRDAKVVVACNSQEDRNPSEA